MKNEIEIQVSKEHGDAEIVDSNKEENSTLIAELEEEKCDVSANNQESTNSRDCRERDLKTKQDNQIDNECGYHLHLDEVSDDENDELLIEVAKSGAPFDKYRSLKKLPLLLWDDNIKSKLKNKIRKTSKMMYLKYGKNGTCFDGVDYIPYFCSSHNTFTCDTKKGGYDLENTETVIFESRSCTDCKLSILDNFIKVIVEAVDKHTEFPPTIQRICELLCYPDCYTNTKSFLYALDKLVCVSIPINVNIENRNNQNNCGNFYSSEQFSCDTNEDSYFDFDLNIGSDGVPNNYRNNNGNGINDICTFKSILDESELNSSLDGEKSACDVNEDLPSVCLSDNRETISFEDNCKKRSFQFKDKYDEYYDQNNESNSLKDESNYHRNFTENEYNVGKYSYLSDNAPNLPKRNEPKFSLEDNLLFSNINNSNSIKTEKNVIQNAKKTINHNVNDCNFDHQHSYNNNDLIKMPLSSETNCSNYNYDANNRREFNGASKNESNDCNINSNPKRFKKI